MAQQRREEEIRKRLKVKRVGELTPVSAVCSRRRIDERQADKEIEVRKF